MGCTPSIHVSQTGVVYCSESDKSVSPRANSLSHNALVTLNTSITPASAVLSQRHSTTRNAPPRHSSPSSSDVMIHNASPGYSGYQATTLTDRDYYYKMAAPIKGASREVAFGPMRIQQHALSILLVFGKEDGQGDGFWWAADKAGYKCSIARTRESALDVYIEKHPDIVIIDNRSSKYYDAEALCRSIRATKCSEHTVIVEVAKRVSGDKEDTPVLPLLQAGFDRRFIENTNVSVCMNELVCLEHGEVRCRAQLAAASALLAAVEHSTDAIEISNDEYLVQYVNPAYEQAYGYKREDLLGRDVRDVSRSDVNKADHHHVIDSQISKGKSWEGVSYIKRKSGDTVSSHCKVTPIYGQNARIRHVVSLMSVDSTNQSLDRNSSADITHIANDTFIYKGVQTYQRKGSFDVRSLSSDGGVHGYIGRRRDSVARIHSMMIEAPITKVINIINAAQENSPITVVQALDKVLEILRSSELYSPFLNPAQAKDDPMTSDLVGGLMTTQSVKRKFSTEGSFKHGHYPSQLVSCVVLSQIPQEVQDLLDKQPNWDFDIIELERLTKKQPLVYLGLKIFQRFGALEYLQISEETLVNWLQMIESNYHTANPYHNSTHAADVMHATAYFLEKENLKAIFDQTDEVASLIAAVVHDLDHPGRTNSFLINEVNDLAVLYNDLTVLESHHVSLAFRITLKDKRVNIFQNVEREDFRVLRQHVVDMVLATEMTKHFEHLSKFVSNINKPGPSKGDDDTSTMSGRATPSSSTCPSDMTTPENRVLIKRMLIKCADVCNPTRPLATCREWALRIAEEYCTQTDEEKKRTLPVVMPVFDRKTCNVPKSQTSFIDFFINNMFDAWDAFCDIPDLMTHLQTNYKYWKEQEESGETLLSNKTYESS